MAEMVWCQSCKTVVWAYDHQRPVDLRGICNMLGLPCPKCGDAGNFDGWNDKGEDLAFYKTYHSEGSEIYDWWSLMKAVASYYEVAWEPSGNNRWFPDNPERR